MLLFPHEEMQGPGLQPGKGMKGKVITMQAAVLHERRTPLVIEDVDLAEPLAGEVRVRLAASGVCHSDYSHYHRDTTFSKLPLVLGHEAAGVVDTVGSGVNGVTPGDHVIVAFGNKCGQCWHCQRGEPYLCTGTGDIPVRLRSGGTPLNQFLNVGSFAPAIVVPATNCVVIRKDAPLVAACLVACGVTTGVSAVVNAAHVEVGSSVAVIGTGGVGLNVIQGARLAGAARIIAIDLLDNKLEYARQFGATHLVNASHEEPVQRVRELTGGRGADFTFEVIGAGKTIQQCYDMARRGGTAVVLGVAPEDATATFSAPTLMRAAKTIIGSNYGHTRPHVDFPRIVDLWMEGKLMVEELISRRFALDEVNEAFRALAAGEVARGVIVYPQ